MMKTERLKPRFVEYIPRELELGVLYISMTYSTTAHLCASGCGNKVVLPLSPAEWQLYYDGRSVSLSPSVGNWDYPCRSHYWIRKNKIRWAGDWTAEQIEEGRRRDERMLDAMFEKLALGDKTTSGSEPSILKRLWRAIWRR